MSNLLFNPVPDFDQPLMAGGSSVVRNAASVSRFSDLYTAHMVGE